MTDRPSPPPGAQPTPKGASPRRIALFAVAAVFLLDQLSKYLVAYQLALPQQGAIRLTSFFDFRWEENRGTAMSMFVAGNETERWLLVAFTGAICSGIALWLWREKRAGQAVALGILLGGALGNVADRIIHGFVVDFADLHIGNWRPFNIFNLADVAITIGVLLLLFSAVFQHKRPPA